VNGRLEQFVDVLPMPKSGLPATTTPEWAAARMAELLDEFAGEQRAGDGLTDFFQHWLQVSNALPGSLDDWHPFAKDWAYFSELSDFTLPDLLAGTLAAEPRRVGILTDPIFLTQKAFASVRGVAMQAALFCVNVPPSPPGIPPLGPAQMDVSHRQQLENAVASPVCSSCHGLMDPAGFSLEHFDSVGQYRDRDNGVPVDSSGAFASPSSTDYEFSSIEAQLAIDVSASCEVARCFAESELEFALRVNGMLALNDTLPADSPDLNRVAQTFADSGRNLRVLARAIAQSSLFLK
jgi:hypothetical protein